MKLYKLTTLVVGGLIIVMGAKAQCLTPITHFHANNSPYMPYNDNFISGFMQSASQQTADNGFLQMPFVGDPLLVYVGEKDSTQFTAYASGYIFEERAPKNYQLRYTRYDITANIAAMPAYCVQRYAYPDTTAEKGFLVDIDNAMTGAANEDMDIVFIDKRTIRAYKRSTLNSSNAPALYYVAHFSHPFNRWNVRREVVRTENGQREQRCKAAFVFDLKPGEELTVQSAVSAVSTDGAYAAIGKPLAKRHFSDQHKAQPQLSINGQPLTAQRQTQASRTTKYPTTAATSRPTQSNSSMTAASTLPVRYIEISTRDAQMQAAFAAALSQLMHNANCRKAANATELLNAIAPLYNCDATKTDDNAVLTDSLLRQYAQSLFTGQSGNLSDTQAAWFVFNAMGLVPHNNNGQDGYKLVRPLFNVVTLHLPRGRRLILHTKNNNRQNLYIAQAKLMHQPLKNNQYLTHTQLLKGGVLEIKMARQAN